MEKTAGPKSSILNMEQLIDTVQELSMARDLEEVMRIVRTVARNLTGADGAAFVLRDGDLCYYADEDAISPLWKGSRFPMHTCISGWVMLNKTPAIIKDIYTDDRIPTDFYRPTFVRSLAMVPIRTVKPLGAIGNYWANQHQPSVEEVKMLQALADITAVSIENIEVRNTLEDKVKERTRELLESLDREKELNEMKSAFVSMASHEFKTPLSTILSSAALCQRYVDTDQQDKRDKHLTRIRSSVQSLTDILNDFLSLDKLEQGKMEAENEAFDLPHFMKIIADDLEGMVKKGQYIRYTHTGEKTVLLDKKMLRNITLNLLSNALKYSTADVDLKTEIQNGKISISVQDYGIGIPLEQQANMFSKFFRASNARDVQGTGLGLNIVKRYIDLLGGTIDFVSTENKGTTFTLTFDEMSLPKDV